MHHCKFFALIILIVYQLIVAKAMAVPAPTQPESYLSFAEVIYAKLSGACRAILNLQFDSSHEKSDLLKTMKILFMQGATIKSFPIDTAFAALTKPYMYDITKQTKVIIHGFKDSPKSHVPLQLAKAYSEKNTFNVLMVDAEEMVNKRYFLSVHNARLVGKRLGNLLANLESFGTNSEDIHLVGISLGAHIAGWAGKYFRQYKGHNIGRITGLDPAGPCFSYAFSDQRLDRTDAKYVDVIHSNRLVQGVIEPLGHADFYLNGGGPGQPGCFMPSCSHLRAAQVYVESIRTPKSFVGVQCRDWEQFQKSECDKKYAVLGYGSSISTRGLYYLRTAAESPFGLGMKGAENAKYKLDRGPGTLNIT